MTGVRAALALLALAVLLPGCLSYDTCQGTACGGACWVCSPLEEGCGTREPDGLCDRDGSCRLTALADCR